MFASAREWSSPMALRTGETLIALLTQLVPLATAMPLTSQSNAWPSPSVNSVLMFRFVEMRRGLGAFVAAKPRDSKRASHAVARQIAERALREAFRHGLLASDLMSALREIAPAHAATPQLPTPE